MTTETNPGALNSTMLADFHEAFEAQPSHQLMQNVVTQHDVNDVALNRNIVAEASHTFSTVLDDWGVTNQAPLRTLLDVRWSEPVPGGNQEPAQRQGVRVQPKLRDVLGQEWNGPTTSWKRSSRRPTALSMTAWWLGCCTNHWETEASGICLSAWSGSTAWCRRP